MSKGSVLETIISLMGTRIFGQTACKLRHFNPLEAESAYREKLLLDHMYETQE